MSETNPAAATAHVHQDPHDSRFLADPYPTYASWHQMGGVVRWEEYGHWCFAAFEDVQRVYKDRRFGRRGCLPEWSPQIERWYETERFSLLALDPPEHTQMRALVNRAFLSRRVEQLRPQILRIADSLIDGFVDAGSVELISAYAAPLPAIVIAELIGLPVEMAPQLLAWSNRMVQMYMHGVTAEMEADADAAAAEFAEYVRDEIAQRRVAPTEDLLTHMLQAEIDGERLSEAEVVATTILLLNAGHEATVHTTGNALTTILTSDIAPSVLFADDISTAATVEECLRIDAPLHLFTRFALEDVEVASSAVNTSVRNDREALIIAAGEPVGLLLGAANHDPARFERPNRFDPFRDDAGNVSFGAGIHFCIGGPLARIELQTSLRRLFERLPDLRLAAEPEVRDIYHFRGRDRLELCWD